MSMDTMILPVYSVSHRCQHFRVGVEHVCNASFSSFFLRYLTTLYQLTYLITNSLRGVGFAFKSLIVTPWFLYGTRRFITVFTKAHHWTLSWAIRIQFAPSIPISLRSILMLSSHVCPGLPSGSYLRASQSKPCKHLSPPPCVPHVPPTSSSLI
jgi:hypothetical protein